MQKSVFQVISQRLKKVDFKLSPDYVFKDEKVLFDIDLQTDTNRHAEKPMAEVSLILSLFKKTNDAPFVCEVIYQGLFTWEKGTPADHVEKYLNCNAPALLYAYIRPLITSLTTMSNLPPLTLPFMNFQSEDKKNGKHK
jgi:preprotein translocase subunit SecB